MIKINTDKFDHTVIDALYKDPASELLRHIRSKITQELRSGINPIVKAFLSKWFVLAGSVSDQKISEYLLHEDPKAVIASFWEIISQIYSGTPVHAEKLSRWKMTKKQALEEKNHALRREIVTSVITRDTVGLFSNINITDVESYAKRGTVISNREKLKQVSFTFSDDLYGNEAGGIRGAYQILEKIFDYTGLVPCFRHKLLTAMHVSVCPYCNRQYITTYESEDAKKSTADIDHFYAKDEYPYLALSLHNFVPSCQICNSRFKLAKDFYVTEHIYPYTQEFGSDAVFKIADLRVLIDGKAPDGQNAFVLEATGANEAVNHSIRTFHLNEVYQSHFDYVSELIWKSKAYNKELIRDYLENFPELFADEKDFLFLLFGPYLQTEDADKRPLAKLTQDILRDLGILD